MQPIIMLTNEVIGSFGQAASEISGKWTERRYTPLLDYRGHHTNISPSPPLLPDPLSRLTIFNLTNNDPIPAISAQTVCQSFVVIDRRVAQHSNVRRVNLCLCIFASQYLCIWRMHFVVSQVSGLVCTNVCPAHLQNLLGNQTPARDVN